MTLRILGLFPANGTAALFPTLMVFIALGAASGGILLISVMSALADIAARRKGREPDAEVSPGAS